MKLYKYRGGDDDKIFNRDLESLRKNYFWASKFDDLNDPCEGLFNKAKNDLAAKVFKELLRVNLYDGLEAFVNILNFYKEHYGIFSLSKSINNDLMWAHYASSHKGYCIEYESEKVLNKYYGFEVYEFDIEYLETPKEITFVDSLSIKRDRLNDVRKIFGRKPKIWSYEEEYRIVTNKINDYPHEFDAVSGIYFGLKMEEGKKKKMQDVLSGRGINFYQMTLKENSYELTYELVCDGSKEEVSYQRIIPDLKNDGLLIPYRFEKRYSRSIGIGFIQFYFKEVFTDQERIQYLCNLVSEEIFSFTSEIEIKFYEEGMSEYFAKAVFKDKKWKKEFAFLNTKKNYNINDYRDFEDLTLTQKFKQESNRLRGSGSIKISKLENGIAYIEYVKDYEEYRNVQPQSRLTETLWHSYWSTGDAVLKAVNDSAVRLMKKIDHIQEVIIKLPFEKNTFTLHARKNEVESFLGYSFKEIRLDWDNTFSNKYVYSKQGRNEFFSKFGKVE